MIGNACSSVCGDLAVGATLTALSAHDDRLAAPNVHCAATMSALHSTFALCVVLAGCASGARPRVSSPFAADACPLPPTVRPFTVVAVAGRPTPLFWVVVVVATILVFVVGSRFITGRASPTLRHFQKTALFLLVIADRPREISSALSLPGWRLQQCTHPCQLRRRELSLFDEVRQHLDR